MDAPTDASPRPAGQVPPPGPRRLRRRPDEGHIAGVCSGVAEYFDVDPVIVRIVAVVLLFSGPGAFAYVLAWIFVPAARGPVPYGAAQAPIDRHDRGTQIFGVVLIVLAVSVFWGDWWSPARHWLLPLGLMGLGAWLLLRRDDDADADEPPTAPPPAPSPPPSAWAWGAGAGDVTVPLASGVEVVAEPGRVAEDATDDTAGVGTTEADNGAPADDTAWFVSAAGGPADQPPTTPFGTGFTPPSLPPLPPTPTVPSRRRVVGPIVFGCLLVWAGVAFLADVALDTGLAGGLLIIGIGFVLGSFVGGSRVLILPALLVAAALAVTAVVDIPLSGPVGQQRWAPTTLAELDHRYEVSLGEGTLDLQAINIPAGERVDIAASVGVGHLVVLVPPGVAVDVTADIGAGESSVFGLQQNGAGVTVDQRDAGDASSGTLALDLQVGLGQLEVRRATDDVSAHPSTSSTSTTALG